MWRACVISFVWLAACQSGAPLGTTCDRNSACSAPLVCRFARCRNECAEQRDCPIGTTCLLDQNGLGSCGLSDDPDCAAPGGSCETPLTCVGHACVNVCTLGVECPPGSECAAIGDGRARCVRADENDAGSMDAMLPDAAMPIDAPPIDAPRGDANLCTPMGRLSGPCDTALDLALGDAFSCVRTTMGHAWCWGTSRSIARDGDTSGCTQINAQDWACPTPSLLRAEDGAGVGDASVIAQLDTLNAGGCYVMRTGIVECWGTIDYEAPLGGVSGTGERARAIHGSGLPIFDRVMLTDGTALAIAHDRVAWWGWGNDSGDVLLHGSVVAMPTPAMFATPPAVDFMSVATGTHHACGIEASGARVRCWGANEHGQSNPSAPSATPVGPTVIANVTHPTQLVAGVTHSCALADEGLVCWGARENLYFDGDVASCAVTDVDCRPTTIPTGALHIVHLFPARNSDDFCATDDGNHLYCWGVSYGSFGRVPDASQVPLLPPIASAVISWTHACALSTDSDVWCWGLNESGELGRGTVQPLGGPVAGPELVMFP